MGMIISKKKRAVKLYKSLIQAIEYDKEYSAMTNTELAKELMELWGEMPVFSKTSCLIDEVILRLGGIK
jgi:hypothetical protein